MTSSPIISPAAFVASYAVAFSDHNGAATNVSQAAPLPVVVNSAQPLPVSGSVGVTNSGSSPLAVNVSNSSPLAVLGSVTVANTSASPVVVSGGVAINNTSASPVPVNTQAAAPTPLSGTATSSVTAGPFTPVIGRGVMLTLTGTWVGSVQLMRSSNGGASSQPITMGGASWGLYSTNCCEPVWDESEAGAQLYLLITLTSGSISYRIAQ